jgi:hypothetical protein
MFADVSHLTQLTSCVGANSCSLGAPTLFGATSIKATNVGEGYLPSADNGNGASFAMTGSNQGMFNSYAAISSFWSDTTAMDNLRAADITATSVAGWRLARDHRRQHCGEQRARWPHCSRLYYLCFRCVMDRICL